MSEVERRRDPRAEPEDDDRPSERPSDVERPFDRRVPALTLKSSSPKAALEAFEDDPELSEATSEVRAIAAAAREKKEASATAAGKHEDQAPPMDDAPPEVPVRNSSSVPSQVERLVDEGNWEGICKMLGPSELASELPPHLAIVYALARAEIAPDDASVVELTIRSTERAHGLPAGSPIARVLAKRLLRRSPKEWRKRPAPRGTISILIVFVALVLGGGGGFWLSTTKVQIPLPSFIMSR